LLDAASDTFSFPSRQLDIDAQIADAPFRQPCDLLFQIRVECSERIRLADVKSQVFMRPCAVADLFYLKYVFIQIFHSLLGDDFLPLLGEIAVAVAIDVQRLAVQHEPNARLRLGTEYQQAISRRLAPVGRFLADSELDLRQIGSAELRSKESD
jgi:hypothetical protein